LSETTPLFIEFQLRSACLLYNIIVLTKVPNLRNTFRRKVSSGRTRASDDNLALQIPWAKTERERIAFSWWGAMLWHSIPTAIRGAESLNTFRQNYIDYLHDKLTLIEIPVQQENRKFYNFV
jgi:hypothetical protein